MQSGTKLVVLLTGLAVALGAYSWWNRYESAHRATQFWGPKAAEVLVEPGKVEIARLRPLLDQAELESTNTIAGRSVGPWLDISDVSGMVHLRYALTTDTNYLWDGEVEAPTEWEWVLRFSREEQVVWVLFSGDFAIVGKYEQPSSEITLLSCQPMAATLQDYFAKLKIASSEGRKVTASKAEE